MQYTHIVLFKSPRDVQQIDIPGKQIELGNTLQTWNADATSTPYCPLRIDLSAKTNVLLRYYTVVTSFSSKFYLPSSRSRVKQINDQKSGLLYSKVLSDVQHSNPEFFSEVPLDFSVSVVKIFYREISEELRRLDFIG